MTVSSSHSSAGGVVFQNSFYIGINIENILYGVTLFLYFKTIHNFLTRGGVHNKSNLFYMLFNSVMVFSVTIWISTQAIFGEKMWLLAYGFPGGPDAYWKDNISVWYMDLGTTAIIILQLMTDALMVYRCRIIWNDFRVVVIPIVLWLATLTLGFVFDWTSSVPGGDFFAGVASEICLAYYTVCVFLNTTLTCMICYRVMWHGKKVKEHLGHQYASLYFTIATMVVESVLPYTLSGIAFLVSMGMGSSTSVVFISVYILMMCISSQMLILRVIVGTAWDKDTFDPSTSTVKFSPGSTSESQRFNSNGRNMHLQTLSSVCYPHGGSQV